MVTCAFCPCAVHEKCLERVLQQPRARHAVCVRCLEDPAKQQELASMEYDVLGGDAPLDTGARGRARSDKRPHGSDDDDASDDSASDERASDADFDPS
eukprot:2508654-Prymnesium_polylepis.1